MDIAVLGIDQVRYYLDRRDAKFEQKMAEVLCVYRQVQVGASRPSQRPHPICLPSPAPTRPSRS
jgi:hypothetical protein